VEAPAQRPRTEGAPFPALELLRRLDLRRRTILPVLLLVFLVNTARHTSAASIDLPQRPDEKPPEKAPTASLFGRPLWIGGDVQARDRYRKNFDLDDTTRDDTLELRHRLTLEALYSIAPHVVAVREGEGHLRADAHARHRRADGQQGAAAARALALRGGRPSERSGPWLLPADRPAEAFGRAPVVVAHAPGRGPLPVRPAAGAPRARGHRGPRPQVDGDPLHQAR